MANITDGTPLWKPRRRGKRSRCAFFVAVVTARRRFAGEPPNRGLAELMYWHWHRHWRLGYRRANGMSLGSPLRFKFDWGQVVWRRHPNHLALLQTPQVVVYMLMVANVVT